MRLVRTTPVADPADRPRALPELALVVALFLAYELARLLIQGRDDVAFANAWRVWDASCACPARDRQPHPLFGRATWQPTPALIAEQPA